MVPEGLEVCWGHGGQIVIQPWESLATEGVQRQTLTPAGRNGAALSKWVKSVMVTLLSVAKGWRVTERQH